MKTAADRLPYTIERTGRNVATVRLKVPSTVAGWEHWCLLRTDAHHDNPKADHALERRHLDECRDRGGTVIDAGDLFCAMQGKYDRRADKSNLRPEHQRADYLDALVTTAADFYSPYAAHWAYLGVGNHESSIKARHETDLTERLAATVRDRTGVSVPVGGYTGWVRFLASRGEQRFGLRVWVGHGWGGGGPVTINTIQAANRMPMMIDGADVIFTGHVHEAWTAEKLRVCLSDSGRVAQRTMHIVQGCTYKDEYGDGHGGWHVETGKPPKPVGAWWLRLTWERNRGLVPHIVRAR